MRVAARGSRGGLNGGAAADAMGVNTLVIVSQVVSNRVPIVIIVIIIIIIIIIIMNKNAFLRLLPQ